MIVGLSGYARSGKDTAGKALIECGFVRRSFADKLRQFLLALDPIVDAEGVMGSDYGYGGELHPVADATTRRLSEVVNTHGWEDAKDYFDEVRELLQRCGTEAGRKVLGENVWVNAVMQEREAFELTVITDVRFPNEAAAVLDRGGMVIRIKRPGVGPRTDDNGDVHPSETALDDWDFDAIVLNDGTEEELREEVLRLSARLMAA